MTLTNHAKNMLVIEMGRITVELSDELEKKLRLKTVEKFGGKKGDLSKAVEEAVKTWISKEK
ncbi:ribbon-helix-helix domain-containing protein [[Eubacterium] cellulosolvens]